MQVALGTFGDPGGDQDPFRVCEALQMAGDVHEVAVRPPAGVQHFTAVEADANADAAGFGFAAFALEHLPL